MENHICGEITYQGKYGAVHSDLCFNRLDLQDPDMKKFLLDNFKEFLENFDGTGHFIINSQDFIADQSQE